MALNFLPSLLLLPLFLFFPWDGGGGQFYVVAFVLGDLSLSYVVIAVAIAKLLRPLTLVGCERGGALLKRFYSTFWCPKRRAHNLYFVALILIGYCVNISAPPVGLPS